MIWVILAFAIAILCFGFAACCFILALVLKWLDRS